MEGVDKLRVERFQVELFVFNYHQAERKRGHCHRQELAQDGLVGETCPASQNNALNSLLECLLIGTILQLLKPESMVL